MIENEFKLMLNGQQFELLRGMFAWNAVIEQTNHYFDTDDLLLFKNHITCRVREINGEFFLQMKLPTEKSHSRIELGKSLGNTLPESLSGEMLAELWPQRQFPDVKLLGALHTTRYAKDFGGMELDLDKSDYFGNTDYEAEIEFTDEAAARDLLATIKEKTGLSDINGDVCKGKVYRFLEACNKI